jgi:hypothetical protein
MDHEEAMLAIKKSFCEESEGMIQSHSTHLESVDSYKNYLADFNYINKTNKDMTIISKNNREKHLQTNTVEFNKFYRNFKMKAG